MSALQYLVDETELGVVRIGQGILLSCMAAEQHPISWLLCLAEMASVTHPSCRTAHQASYCAYQALRDRPLCGDAALLASAIHCLPEAHC